MTFCSESIITDRATFSQLYNRYAPMLLGVITAIVQDETEAVRLLEITFNEVWLRYPTARPANQPLFVWLLSIARSVALSAAKNNPAPQIAITGSVVAVVSAGANADTPTADSPGSLSTNALLNTMLFRNCTPEEAISSTGLPVATARQQLRQAMQQLRMPGVS